MKRSGCFVIGGLVLVAGCILSLVIAIEFLRPRAEEIQEALGSQPATELVRVASLPPGSSLTIGGGQIEMAAFSPDGQTLVTATTRGLVFYDTAATRPRLSIPVNLGVDELAWSPDGQALAVASGDVSLSLYEPATGQQTLVLDVRDALVSNLAWSPDGRYLAATILETYHRDAWIWDAQTGERLFALPDGSGFFGLSFARDVSWSPEGNQLVVAFSYSGLGEPLGGRDEIQVWEIGDEPILVSKWPIETYGVFQVAWAAGGRYLVLQETTSLRVLDSQSGETLAATDGDLLPLRLFALSPDGATLVAATNSSAVLSYFNVPGLELSSQSETTLLGVGSLGWSPDGTSVVATERYSDLFQVWSWADNRLLAEASTGSPQAVGLAWSPDSRLLMVAAADGLARLYDGQTGQLVGKIGDRASGAPDVGWSFDGRLLATTHVEQTEDGREFTTLIWSPDGELKASIAGHLVAWAGRSNRLLTAPPNPYYTSSAQVWNVAVDGQPTKAFEFDTELGRWVWSPDDSLIAGIDQQHDSSVGIYSKIVVLELESQSPVAELHTTDMRYVRGMAWSPDGAWLAASYDYNCPRPNCARLEIWNTATWQSHKTFGRLDSSSGSLSWSPDSRWIVATVSPTGSAITLYPLDDQQPIRELDHHLGLDMDAAWSPDGRRIASTSYDGRLTIWDAAALLPSAE